jgi:hypothetical protein
VAAAGTEEGGVGGEKAEVTEEYQEEAALTVFQWPSAPWATTPGERPR